MDGTKKGLLRRLLDAVAFILGAVLFLGLCILAPALIVGLLVLGGPAVVLIWARQSGRGARSKARR